MLSTVTRAQIQGFHETLMRQHGRRGAFQQALRIFACVWKLPKEVGEDLFSRAKQEGLQETHLHTAFKRIMRHFE